MVRTYLRLASFNVGPYTRTKGTNHGTGLPDLSLQETEQHFKVLSGKQLIVYEWSHLIDSRQGHYRRGKVEVPFEHVERINVMTHNDVATLLVLELKKPPNVFHGDQYWDAEKKKRGGCSWKKGNADEKLLHAVADFRFHKVVVGNARVKVERELKHLLCEPTNLGIAADLVLEAIPPQAQQGFEGSPTSHFHRPLSLLGDKKRKFGMDVGGPQQRRVGLHVANVNVDGGRPLKPVDFSNASKKFKGDPAAKENSRPDHQGMHNRGMSKMSKGALARFCTGRSRKQQQPQPGPPPLSLLPPRAPRGVSKNDVERRHNNNGALSPTRYPGVLPGPSPAPAVYFKYLKGLLSPIRFDSLLSPSFRFKSPFGTRSPAVPNGGQSQSDERPPPPTPAGRPSISMHNQHRMRMPDVVSVTVDTDLDLELRDLPESEVRSVLGGLNVMVLKGQLEKRKLRKSGRKLELIERLLKHVMWNRASSSCSDKATSSHPSSSSGSLPVLETPLRKASSLPPLSSLHHDAPAVDADLDATFSNLLTPLNAKGGGVLDLPSLDTLQSPGLMLAATPTPLRRTRQVVEASADKSEDSALAECPVPEGAVFHMPPPVVDGLPPNRDGENDKLVAFRVPASEEPLCDGFSLIKSVLNDPVSAHFRVSVASSPWISDALREHCVLLLAKHPIELRIPCAGETLFQSDNTQQEPTQNGSLVRPVCFACSQPAETFELSLVNPFHAWLTHKLRFNPRACATASLAWDGTLDRECNERMRVCANGHITLLYLEKKDNIPPEEEREGCKSM